MGNIVGKQFGVVASKNYATALAESVKEGNQAKFYLAQKDGEALDGLTEATYNDRNTLIINGNTIQGISDDDISKLDAITDVTRLFKYKGSVDTFGDLPTGNFRDVSVGDVWSIKSIFTLEGVTYPAHTSVVCVTAAYGSAPVIRWDALGGTMEMGTSVSPTVISSSVLFYKTEKDIPISSFRIELGSDTGIVAGSSGIIELRLTSKAFTTLQSDQLYIDNNGSPLESVMLNIDSTTGLYANPEGSLSMHLGEANVKQKDRDLNFFSDSPINNFTIRCRGGLSAGSDGALYLKLSTSSGNSNDLEFTRNRVSGLSIDSDGRLFVALSSAGTNRDLIDALLRVEQSDDLQQQGGLIIYGPAIASWLINQKALDIHIGSLIDAKLQAQ